MKYSVGIVFYAGREQYSVGNIIVVSDDDMRVRQPIMRAGNRGHAPSQNKEINIVETQHISMYIEPARTIAKLSRKLIKIVHRLGCNKLIICLINNCFGSKVYGKHFHIFFFLNNFFHTNCQLYKSIIYYLNNLAFKPLILQYFYYALRK